MLPLPLETARLHIRAPARKDMDTWVLLYTDPKVLAYMDRAVDRSADEWWARLQGRFASVELPLTVAEKAQDHCIGQAGFLKVRSDQTSVEIYCRLLPETWRQGYGSEICQALVSAALGGLGMQRVVGYVHPKNTASIAMMRRLGFSHAGKLVDPGGWQDGHEIYEKTDL